MLKRFYGRAIVLVIVALALGWCGVSAFRGRPVAVTRSVEREVAQTLVVNGRVLAPQRVALGVKEAGVVAKRFVEEGDRVRKGQPLLELDERDARAEVAAARAKLRTLAEVGVVSTEGAAREAQVAFENAERDAQRYEQLFAEGIVSRTQLDQARQTLAAARSTLDAARAQQSSTRSGADLASARAALELAEARLEQRRIVAPADGVVLTRAVEAGDSVTPGKALYTLALDAPTQILAQPDERFLARLALGQKALVSADAYRDRRFAAEVVFLSPAVDAQRGTIDIKLAIPDPPPFLRTDMTVSLEIEEQRKGKAVVVPAEAVRDPQRSPYVLVLQDGRAARQPVVIGLRGDREVELASGLPAGELVITDPAAREGERVRPRGGSSPAGS